MSGDHPTATTNGDQLRRRTTSTSHLSHLKRIPPPPPKLSLLARLKRYLRNFRSPLNLRYSIVVLRKRYAHPYLALLRLFFRIPWRFPTALPPPPREIRSYPEQAYMDTHHARLFELRLVPIWQWRDTPQRSFFRLYEAFCAGDDACISYETEYFWKRSEPEWQPCLLADPRDYGCADPEQYAVLASLAEDLVDAFNWRLELGLRRDGEHTYRRIDAGRVPTPFEPATCPPWAKRVPRLDERLILHELPDPGLCASNRVFDRRNIQASGGSLRTV